MLNRKKHQIYDNNRTKQINTKTMTIACSCHDQSTPEDEEELECSICFDSEGDLVSPLHLWNIGCA